jgi:sigma-54 dependent transcriptional regulator, acetoin dehydrogenase operon transcriptional activator AcoR
MDASTGPAREAWRKYVSTGALARTHLREPVYRAWERCHLLGASPEQARAESLSPSATEVYLKQRSDLVAAAQPFMGALSRAAARDRHAAMLGDENGIVLDIVGDEETVQGPEPFPGPGALLAEEVSGANGIGTPLAEGDYLELVGPEHFIGGFHVFTCQGVPVHAPDGSVAGVISTSVRRVEASQRLRDILLCAARGMEAELLRGRLEEDLRRVLATASDGALTRLRDDLVQSYASARVRIDTAARRAARGDRVSTLAVVREAQAAIDRFREQASLWRELASGETGAHQAIALHDRAAAIVELLRTEARIRQAELAFMEVEPATVVADVRALSRALLSALVSALREVAHGGAVRVATRADARNARAEVLVIAEPPPGTPTSPSTRRLEFPMAGPQ